MFDTCMKSLAVRLLGEFAVDGVESSALGSRKARLALHLLALADGHPVHGDVLADALWADSPPASPEDQLAVLMSRLRSVLGRDRIERRSGGYVLHADWQDDTELGQLLAEMDRRRQAGNVVGAAAAARVAISLLRGGTPAQLPGEWAQLRRAALDRLIGRTRLAAAAALLAAGDWMAAADTAGGTLEQDPYDEAALRILMRAYVAGGQAATALAAFAGTRERLAEDLGTDPSPATAQLHAAILAGELAPATVQPAARQPATDGIVGRADELTFLDACAAMRGAGQIIVVDGEPGIGKTSLLRAWAARRTAAGDIALVASCGQLDRAMPLDALLGALADLRNRLEPQDAAQLLGDDANLLGPLLGMTAGAQPLQMLADSMLGPVVLYAALAGVLSRLARRAPLVVAIDDGHLGGRALRDFLQFIRRQKLPFVIVVAVRPGSGETLPATSVIHLDVLGRDAAAELVGADRVEALYGRSRGNPLFLTELAQQAASASLPATLVESVSVRCDELGAAAGLLRAAAVIGPELDLDLISAVLGRPVVELLDDSELAVAQHFLADTDGRLRFRHELVREALATSATAGRSALLHRQVGRVLAQRAAADPVMIAHHARLGGDLALAASALRDAAEQAAERFDHAAAEALLDDALSLASDAPGLLARARVRIRLGRYSDALADVEASGLQDAGALEVSAWAAYFGRRFDQSAQFADDGAMVSAEDATRARCLAVAGRVRHAAGDLAGAEARLAEALSLAEGADRVTAAAWLGVLRAHQSRPAEAVQLLRPAARGQIGAEHTSATMHALLFTGHAHAIAGYPEQALAAFARHTEEVARRQVPRFAGRGVNFTGWVLRNLGARSQAVDLHSQALAAGRSEGTPEVTIAALQDLAETRLEAQDPDGAAALLAEASAMLTGDLVFGWRLALKRDLLAARLALLRGDYELASTTAAGLEETAVAIAVPRYSSVARILRHRAHHAAGLPVQLDAAAADLDLVERSVAIEAWWWTGETAAQLGVGGWLERAQRQAARLADNAGVHADTLRREAASRLLGWQARIR
jgi:DNA-binding SARP family transcriptional activator/tetratricopeptide (TPR) repeat protein